MEFIYHDLIINYEVKGSGEALIILHGWNADTSIYESIINMLKRKYLVYIIDLPGFGESMLPSRPYSLDDYVDFVHTFISNLNIDNPIIIGHSFGGRIAIRYVNKFEIKKLILISSAGIKRFNLKTKYKICKYKLKKKYYILTRNIPKLEELQNNSGSSDYQCLNNTMKRTMINIINTDQTKELKNVNVPTLLLWGKRDLQTPYKDALLMNKKIKDSGLVTFNYSGHFPFIDEEYLFIKVLASFLEVGDSK